MSQQNRVIKKSILESSFEKSLRVYLLSKDETFESKMKDFIKGESDVRFVKGDSNVSELEAIQSDILFIDLDRAIDSINQFVFLFLASISNERPQIIFVSEADLSKFKNLFTDKKEKIIPLEFLSKDISAIKRCLDTKREQLFAHEQKNKQRNHLSIPVNGGVNLKIKIKDIVYLESYGNYSNVHLDKPYLDKKKIVAYKNLGQITSELPENYFYRVHKSYTINKSKIENPINKNTTHLEVQGTFKIPISRRKFKDFLDWFHN